MGSYGSTPSEDDGVLRASDGHSDAEESAGKTDAAPRPDAEAAPGDDHWIDERVRSLYEADLEEPLPDDMQLLIRSITEGSRS